VAQPLSDISFWIPICAGSNPVLATSLRFKIEYLRWRKAQMNLHSPGYTGMATSFDKISATNTWHTTYSGNMIQWPGRNPSYFLKKNQSSDVLYFFNKESVELHTQNSLLPLQPEFTEGLTSGVKFPPKCSFGNSFLLC